MSTIIEEDTFEARQERAAAVAAPLAANLAEVMYEAWMSSDPDPEYRRLSAALDVADGDERAAAQSAIEEHMFLVGFELARRLMGGAK